MKNIALLLLLAVYGIACGHRNNTNVVNPTAFACPMDCEKGKTYPQAGSCPVCKMDLEGIAAPVPAAAQQDSTAPTPLKTLEQETMRIHDEAMAEMAEMNRVGRDMKDFMKRARMTQEGMKRWQQVLTDIEKAEEGMMNWMAGYKAPAGQPEADALKYLQEQKERIDKNQADIRAATAAGKALLGK